MPPGFALILIVSIVTMAGTVPQGIYQFPTNGMYEDKEACKEQGRQFVESVDVVTNYECVPVSGSITPMVRTVEM